MYANTLGIWSSKGILFSTREESNCLETDLNMSQQQLPPLMPGREQTLHLLASFHLKLACFVLATGPRCKSQDLLSSVRAIFVVPYLAIFLLPYSTLFLVFNRATFLVPHPEISKLLILLPFFVSYLAILLLPYPFIFLVSNRATFWFPILDIF